MKNNYEPIKIEKENGSLKGELLKHPSFGLISFSRSYGGENMLFGSSIKNNNTIRMELKYADCRRNLSNDWYYGNKKIVEVEMSLSQFSELITSMNIGSGVPCTIRYTEKDGRIPKIQENPSKKSQFMDEFVEKIEDAMEITQKQINELKSFMDSKKNFGVKDKNEMINRLMKIKQNIGTNLNFCSECFNEQMDKTVMEAKCEVEAFYQNRINSIAQKNIIEDKK